MWQLCLLLHTGLVFLSQSCLFSGNLRAEKSHFKQTAKESQDCTCDDFVPTSAITEGSCFGRHTRQRTQKVRSPSTIFLIHGGVNVDIPVTERWQVPEPYECRKFQKLEVEVLAHDAAHSTLVTKNQKDCFYSRSHESHVSQAAPCLAVTPCCATLLQPPAAVENSSPESA